MNDAPAVPLPGHRGGHPGGPGRRPVGAGRPPGGQPADRRDDGDRGRRLRGGRPPGQPGPRGARAGRARVGHAADPARASCRDGSSIDGQSLIMRTSGIERVWLTPDDVARLRGRPRRPSPRPTSSSSARAACTRASSRACSSRASGRRSSRRHAPRVLRLQRRDPGRRDRRLRPRRARRGAGRPHGARHRRRRPRQQPLRRQGRRDVWRAEPVRLRWPPAVEPAPAARPRRRRRPGERPPPRSRRAWRRRCSIVERESGARRRSCPDRLTMPGTVAPTAGDVRRPVTRSERDLVLALRAELAGIDPSRACDRTAEAAGLGSRGPARRDAAGSPRLARPAGRASERPARDRRRARRPAEPAFDWDHAADHCRIAWLRGRFLARGSLSLAGRADPPRVRRRRRRGAGPRRAARGRRAAGVVAAPARSRRGDLEERRSGRDVPAPHRCRRRACSSSRPGRSRGRCAATSTASSTRSRRTCSARSRPPAASSTRSRSLEADGRLGEQPEVVRLVAAARRETPEATLSRARRAAAPPPIGGPARARAGRGPGRPRR